jgi:hypothetical protein
MSSNERMLLAVATETAAANGYLWERLRDMTANMFAVAHKLILKFAYFTAEDARNIRPCVTTNWITNRHDMRDMLDRAEAECICGCYVHVDDILAHVLREAQQAPVQTVILIGDNFSGDVEEAQTLAKKLRALGTRVFVLQPRHWHQRASRKLKMLAETTGGAFFDYDPELEPITERLPTILEMLAHYTVGGTEALEQQASDSEAAVLLLEQMTAVPFSIEFKEEVPFTIKEPVPVTKKENKQ